MRHFLIFSALLCVVLTGCESKTAKLARLQDEYSKAAKQHYDDCIAPSYGGVDDYMKGKKPTPPTPEQEAAQQKKCLEEAKRAGDLQMEMQQAMK
jgi:hypothetical protein